MADGRHLIALALAAMISAAPAVRAELPIERFVRTPAVGQPDISPNGRYLAVPRREDGGFVVRVVDLQSPAVAPVIMRWTGADIERARWANDQRVLLTVAANRLSALEGSDVQFNSLRRFRRLFVVGRDGTNVTGLLVPNRQFRLQSNLTDIVHMLPDSPNEVLMALRSGGRYGLYRVNVDNGKIVETEVTSRLGDYWLTDLKGVPRVRWDYDPDDEQYMMYLRRGDSDSWDKVFEYARSEVADFRIVGFADDPRTAIVASRQGSDKIALYEYDTMTRTLGRQLFANPNYDVGYPFGDVLYDPWTSRLVGVSYAEDLWSAHYFDSELAQIQASVGNVFPDETVRLMSWSKDKQRIIVRTESPKNPGKYHLVDWRAAKSEVIGHVAPQLPSHELGEMAAVSYRARDGVKISGYLTLPPGRGDKNLPLVVMPHGGPELRDTVGFDPWAQSIANAGYLVFQPNFRGSGGYGRAFAAAGHRQWGRRMQDDLTDGVKALIADGTVDPKRVCIVGASYGGYAALAGGAFTPELYKCVVSIAGVSNLRDTVREARYRGRETSDFRYWVSRVGHADNDRAELEAWSPVKHAAKFQAPVLLIHGKWDWIVPPDHSRRMDEALREAGKSSTLVIIDYADHSFEGPPIQFQVLSEVRKFLKQYLGE